MRLFASPKYLEIHGTPKNETDMKNQIGKIDNNDIEGYSKLVKSRDPQEFVKYYDRIYEGVKVRFFGRPVTIHRMSTAEWFNTFDKKLDWIYVDASHAYEGCLHDLTNAVKFIKPGGKLLGDDYGPKKIGVRDAVDTLIKNTGYTLNNFHADQFEVQL